MLCENKFTAAIHTQQKHIIYEMHHRILVLLIWQKCTVIPRFEATLFNNYEAGGRYFWRLKNYIEVLVSHI